MDSGDPHFAENYEDYLDGFGEDGLEDYYAILRLPMAPRRRFQVQKPERLVGVARFSDSGGHERGYWRSWTVPNPQSCGRASIRVACGSRCEWVVAHGPVLPELDYMVLPERLGQA